VHAPARLSAGGHVAPNNRRVPTQPGRGRSSGRKSMRGGFTQRYSSGPTPENSLDESQGFYSELIAVAAPARAPVGVARAYRQAGQQLRGGEGR
jgi:hypothetical protein